MLVLVLFMVTLHQVQSACNVAELCPTDPLVQDQIVDKHNAFRRSVQPPAANMLKMNWNDDVAALAQGWVDHCVLAHGPISSRLLNDYELGENIFYSSGKVDWDTVITAWYNEVNNFKYPNISTEGKVVGHYTQVVWNSSWRVGCGVKQCEGVFLYSCQYYRAGNFIGWPPYKEGAPCSSCPENCDDKLCTNPCPYINRYLNCPSLKAVGGCDNAWVNSNCPAECQCPTEIIPVYKK